MMLRKSTDPRQLITGKQVNNPGPTNPGAEHDESRVIAHHTSNTACLGAKWM
jgi:hypothetical protein